MVGRGERCLSSSFHNKSRARSTSSSSALRSAGRGGSCRRALRAPGPGELPLPGHCRARGKRSRALRWPQRRAHRRELDGELCVRAARLPGDSFGNSRHLAFVFASQKYLGCKILVSKSEEPSCTLTNLRVSGALVATSDSPSSRSSSSAVPG